MESERLKLLREIQEYEFVAVELNLFLDTHPDDLEPLRRYNETTRTLQRLKEAYESRYGPLTHFGYTTSGEPWQWIEGPWPWEIEY